MQELMDAPMNAWRHSKASLPLLPPLSSSTMRESQAELSLIVGMLTEQLGETAATPAFRREYYKQADDLFQNALSFWHTPLQEQQNDLTLLKRGCQYVINVLEERTVAHTQQSEQHVQTLLNLLKKSLLH